MILYSLIIISLLLSIVVIVLMAKISNTQKHLSRNTGQEILQEFLKQSDILHERQLSEQRENYQRQIHDLSLRIEQRDKELREISANQFTALSSEILSRQSESLRSNASREFSTILEPLKRQLDDFRNEFLGNTKTTKESHDTLRGEISTLIRLNKTIGEEAENLARALKGNSQVQGAWGEKILESLLERAGLVRNINYTIQQTTDEFGNKLTDEAGRGKRPDVVISLPGNRKIIIDSKASLAAYMAYVNAEDNEQKRKAARKHVDAIKRHLDEIHTADYPSVISGSLELVIMFMPNEAAYFTAFQTEPDIWKYAYERKVMLATPTHLFAVVQLVAQLWQQDSQNRNAEEIGKTAGLLYDKVVDFIVKFESVGTRINKCNEEYQKCYNSVTRGKKSIVGLSNQLKNLGASTSSSIPTRFTETSEEPEIPLSYRTGDE